MSRQLEGPHRLGQLDGRQPDQPGPRHRPGHHRGGQRRPVAARSRSTRRGELLELKSTVNTMVDQLSAVRRRGHPGRPRGRHRGPARRPGRRCAASPAPGRTSPTTSTSWPATSPPRSATSPRSPPPWPSGDLTQKITVDAQGEILELEEHHQHDGRPAVAPSPTRSPASPARSAPRAGSAARPRSRASPAPGRTSPTTSTSWPAT